MLQNQEPDRDFEELTDAEIYSAISYLDPESHCSEEPDYRGGVVAAIILLIFVLGLVAFFWFYS